MRTGGASSVERLLKVSVCLNAVGAVKKLRGVAQESARHP
jgi:hypothetical protein